jgi:hypothetical protein
MDCEKFDEHVMDALYGELPELTEAALRRHVESCARCAAAYASLKATREAAVLPLEEPSADLEDRILAAEKTVYGRAPWHKKLVRAAAWAGSHAMRPQLAMAALFMFVIGSSLLLLRARPGTVAAPVSVEQQGSPEMARADKQQISGEGGPLAGRAAMDDRAESEKAPAKGARSGEGLKADAATLATAEAPAATAAPSAVPAPTVADDAGTLLAEAKALKDRDGCTAAAPKLESVAKNFAGTDEGKAAADELARCAHPSGAAGGSMAKSAAPSATATAKPTATATVPPGP